MQFPHEVFPTLTIDTLHLYPGAADKVNPHRTNGRQLEIPGRLQTVNRMI